MVSPASRMFNAISLGVFFRVAPSTRPIIRSRKVSPGFEVILTLISSESTRVPPVTAERSPPDSRITGADSPVMADSSTDATPSTTSPSPGINSPALTITRSPARSFEPGTSSVVHPSERSRRAIVSARALRSVSACALPRPSAIASAKFANSTVNHSHNVICSANPTPAEWLTMYRTRSTVVITAPTSTTNITGFFISVRGFNLIRESQIARCTIPEVHIDFRSSFDFLYSPTGAIISGVVVSVAILLALENLSGMQQQMLENRTQAERREKRERAHDQNHTD